jgi:hypothetical protein
MNAELFHIVTFFVFSFTFVSFKTKNTVNVSFKLLCFFLSLWSLLLILIDRGYILKF